MRNLVITRRRWLGGSLATAALASLSSPVRAALALTPAQTPGPFYPREFPADIDNDLVRFTGAAARAMGTVTHIRGRVLSPAGEPIGGARVEIWQCDANGRYHLVNGGGTAAPDENFQGFGHMVTGADGAYTFRTIRPVRYPGRTPHIHFAVIAPDAAQPFITQMYIEGEPGNVSDGLYQRLGADAARVTVALNPTPEVEPEALAGTFDIVIG